MNAAPLPIQQSLPELCAALQAHPNVVLQAPPGAGKSTGVPLALLHQPWLKDARIVMLEPRRIAARAVATRMAATLGEAVGDTVGYRTRLESRVSARTRIEVVTEGILTRWLQRDAALEGVGLVIFDEFHERSLHADLGLALCLDAQQALRDDLRILVMSATLDGEALSRLLDNAPIITATGRSYDVDVRYRERSPARGPQYSAQNELVPLMTRAIQRALEEEPGDMLVFLPGQGEIHRVQQLLQQAQLPGQPHILPLYGELPAQQQDAALQPATDGRRKIVLATNIAETSLTIEGIRIVVDSGLERRARFDPASGMSRLVTSSISRASAEQRRGRAGRLEDGACYRLWTQSEHAALAPRAAAEIMEADLTSLVLELANWGIRDPAALRWLDSPPAAAFTQARDLLQLLEAIGPDDRITEHGKALARLGTHPRLAHMIVCGEAAGLGGTALEIAALLGERDLLRVADRNREVDLRLRLDALHGHALPIGIQMDHGVRQRVMRSLDLLSRQFKTDRSRTRDTEDAGRALALAYPDRIAQSRGSGGRYLLSSGRGAVLPPAQALANATLLVVADLDAGDREAAIRLAAPITQAQLEADFSAHIQHRERCEWEPREQAVAAREEHWLGAIKLREKRLERPAPERVLQALLTGIRTLGLQSLPWTDTARALRERMMFARIHEQAVAQWPDVSDDTLLETLEDWLAPWLDGISRRDHLARLDMHAILQSLLDWNDQQALDTFAPTHLRVPSGSRIAIDYSSASPTVSVRLQEVFGLQQTPRVAVGRVPVTMQLLSPARRPVQVTQDLESFWARGYQEVKKELKGRYPRHYWPEDPLQAEATARARPRPR